MAGKDIEISETPARALPSWAERIARNWKKVLVALLIGIPLFYYLFLYEPLELIAANYMREACGVPADDYPYADYYYSEVTDEYLIRFSIVESAFGSVYYAALNVSNWSQYACVNESPVSVDQYIKMITQQGEAAKEHYDAYLQEIYERYGITENNTSEQT